MVDAGRDRLVSVACGITLRGLGVLVAEVGSGCAFFGQGVGGRCRRTRCGEGR